MSSVANNSLSSPNAELQQSICLALSECKDPYALAYLNAIDTSLQLYGSEGLKTQLLYCLSNMQYWRGPIARQCKAVFKKYSK